jgi:hypothetical protein
VDNLVDNLQKAVVFYALLAPMKGVTVYYIGIGFHFPIAHIAIVAGHAATPVPNLHNGIARFTIDW